MGPLNRHREKRALDTKLRNTKTLGAAGDDVDDLAAWVERSRLAEAAKKAEERAKAEKLARGYEEEVRNARLFGDLFMVYLVLRPPMGDRVDTCTFQRTCERATFWRGMDMKDWHLCPWMHLVRESAINECYGKSN